MDKIEVFLFKTFDVASGKTVLSKNFATREAIESISATPVEESKIAVDPSALDDHGRYQPQDEG